MSLILDTSVLLGLLDSKDSTHADCVALIDSSDEPLVVPVPVLVELSFWVRHRFKPSAWRGFCNDAQSGAYRLHYLTEKNLARAVEIDEQYADLNLGFVDASVITTCEELDETKVATLDRRDFAAIRPTNCESLTILPE